MANYSIIFDNYGPEWDPSSKINNANPNCPFRFAVQVRDRIEQVLKHDKMVALCPKVKLAIKYIDNVTVNAVACKGSAIEEDYLIAVFAGAYIKLQELFSSEIFLSNLKSKLKVFSRIPNANLALNCLSYAVSFLFFHEVGHVYRGHLNYFPKRNLSLVSSLLWDEQIQLNTSDFTSSSEMINKRHLSECDADAFAGTIVGGQIYYGSKSILREKIFDNTSFDTILSDSIFLASMSIHTVFCIFNEFPTPSNGDYPHPIIRSGVLHGHIAQKLNSLDKDIDIKGLGLLVTESVSSINAIAVNLGIDMVYADLGREFAEWESKYWDILHSFGHTLQPYSPCRRT